MSRFITRLKAAIGTAAMATALLAPAVHADAAPGATCERSIKVGSVVHDEGTPPAFSLTYTKFTFPVTTTVTSSPRSTTPCTVPAKSVSYASAHGTTDSSDLTSTSGTLSWAAGDVSARTITVWGRADITIEDDEYFIVTVRSTGTVTTALASGLGVIVNDDYNKCWGFHCGQ